MATVGAAIFFVSAWQLNPLALMLAPVAAAYVVLYSFAKYYTWLCSLMLGLALSIAPSGAWIGVTGQLILAAGIADLRRGHVGRRLRDHLRQPGLRFRPG